MTTLTQAKISKILDAHTLWLADASKGACADLRGADLCGVDLRRAKLRGAKLRGADLCDANLRGVDLRDVNLRDADLCYADLRDANLRDADLRDVNLRGVDLRGVDLRGEGTQYYLTQRTDGYQFFLRLNADGEWMVVAGCRTLTISQYREHTETYADEVKKTETNLILDFAEAKLKSTANTGDKL